MRSAAMSSPRSSRGRVRDRREDLLERSTASDRALDLRALFEQPLALAQRVEAADQTDRERQHAGHAAQQAELLDG